MKLFVKQNLIIILLFSIAVIIFGCLLTLSFSLSNSSEELISDIKNLRIERDDIASQILSYGHIKADKESSSSDLASLATKEKDLSNFLSYLFNAKENVSSKWDSKSAESVNASLTRLFSRLRKSCNDKNILLPTNADEAAGSVPFANPGANNKEVSFGFSFSAYDGFWPSFTVYEARQIGIQSEIVKNLVDAITLSTDANHSIEIISLQRESVGDIDKVNISADQIDLSRVDSVLLRQIDGIESYVFQVTLKIQTSSLRKFVNKLRPPFLLREISISPIDGDVISPPIESSFDLDPFSTNPEDDKKFLPIVSKVDSKVDIIVEYITKAERNLQNIFQKTETLSESSAKIYFQWLEASGKKKLAEQSRELFDENNNQ
jgi:hypothetical protein